MKNDGGAKMVVAFTKTEMKYLVVKYFSRFGGPPLVSIFVMLSSLATIFVMIPA